MAFVELHKAILGKDKTMIELQNGATVLAVDVKQKSNGSYSGHVLAHAEGAFDKAEYVTWAISESSKPGDSKFDAFWGHYFREYDQALQDYDNRR
jgi:hypothetical protein